MPAGARQASQNSIISTVSVSPTGRQEGHQRGSGRRADGRPIRHLRELHKMIRTSPLLPASLVVIGTPPGKLYQFPVAPTTFRHFMTPSGIDVFSVRHELIFLDFGPDQNRRAPPSGLTDFALKESENQWSLHSSYIVFAINATEIRKESFCCFERRKESFCCFERR